MSKKELEFRITELEKRIKELESRAGYISVDVKDFPLSTGTQNPDWRKYIPKIIC